MKIAITRAGNVGGSSRIPVCGRLLGATRFCVFGCVNEFVAEG